MMLYIGKLIYLRCNIELKISKSGISVERNDKAEAKHFTINRNI